MLSRRCTRTAMHNHAHPCTPCTKDSVDAEAMLPELSLWSSNESAQSFCLKLNFCCSLLKHFSVIVLLIVVRSSKHFPSQPSYWTSYEYDRALISIREVSSAWLVNWWKSQHHLIVGSHPGRTEMGNAATAKKGDPENGELMMTMIMTLCGVNLFFFLETILLLLRNLKLDSYFTILCRSLLC